MAKNGNEQWRIVPIDLALSGGGSRAAGFHLGSLSLLKEIKLHGENKTLLSEIRALSTVSGGSFTGAKYVLSLAEGMTFWDFFIDFYNMFSSVQAVKMGFQYLAEGKASIPSGRRSLIASMAQVYADTFLKKKDGKPALFEDLLNFKQENLKEVIFNTTEFIRGSSFRFQIRQDSSGNTCMRIPCKEAANIRLADIVAASSCIPGAFGPMAFPEDFVWSDPSALESVRNMPCFSKPGVPLMDGGIYDNLGAHGLLCFEEFDCDPHEKSSTVIVSDVFLESEELYKPPDKTRKGRFTFLTLRELIWSLRIVFALCAVSAAVVGYAAYEWLISHDFNLRDLFLYVIPFLLAVSTAVILLVVRHHVNGIKKIVQKAVPQIDNTVVDSLQRVTLASLTDMLLSRAASLMALTNSIFMTRIRELTYEIVQHREQPDPDVNGQQDSGGHGNGSECYGDKLIHCRISDLRSGRRFDYRLEKLGIKKASTNPVLQGIIDISADVQTEMWFDHPYTLPCLVVSGQATLCYNLMGHVFDLYGEGIPWENGMDYDGFKQNLPPYVQSLWGQLVDIWHKLVADPYWILKEHIPANNLPQPPSTYKCKWQKGPC
jgi:predicted acylesterase/phospholipase RssA